MSIRKCIMFTGNCKLRRGSLADMSADHMAQSFGTVVPHIVQILYSIALLGKVHMYQSTKRGTACTPYVYTRQPKY